MKSIIHANIYDYESYRPDTYVLYDDTIRKIGPMSEYLKPAECTEELDAEGAFLMPSFVIGHAHIYGAFLRAWTPPLFRPLCFREHLQQVHWLLDGGLDRESSYHSAKATALDHIRSGVTTIFDHQASGGEITGTLDALKQGWVDESGLRAMFCFEVSDRFPVDICIRENVDFYEKSKGKSNMYAGMFGMHASLTLSEKTLDKVAETIGDIPLHVHVAEGAEDEIECESLYGKRVVERYRDHKLITPNSVFAHCVNINLREAAIMAEYGVTAAINTTSNINGGHGVADYRDLRRMGVRTMIGNDSLGTNIVTDIRNFVFAQHTKAKNAFSVNETDALLCLNINFDHASRLLGVKLGRIREGYAADMLTVDYNPITPMDGSNVWAHVFDGIFQQFRPRNVWCAGVRKLKNYAVTLDEERICDDARRVCAKLWESLK